LAQKLLDEVHPDVQAASIYLNLMLKIEVLSVEVLILNNKVL